MWASRKKKGGIEVISKYRCKSCHTEGLYADGAKHCPLCGGDLIKIADGGRAFKRCVRHSAWFAEGALAMGVVMSIGEADLISIATLAGMMLAVAPFTRVWKKKAKKERREEYAR